MIRKTIWDGADTYWDLDVLGVRPFTDGPNGITVHYTADGSLRQSKNAMLDNTRGYRTGYHFVIDRDGKIHQTASLGKTVNHAGVAAWNGQSPNRSHLAVALISWGLLKGGKSWAGTAVLDSRRDANGEEWDAATHAQERSLSRLLEELMEEFKIEPQNICGHDECCIPKGRKVDPGGVLSRPLSGLRKGIAH